MHRDPTPSDHTPNPLSFEDKLIRLVEHWIKHNADHARTYREWTDRARTQGLSEAAGRLEEVATMTDAVTGKFDELLFELRLSAESRRNEFSSS